MSSDDRRHLDKRTPVARFEFAQGIWASSESGALTKTLANLSGTIYAIEVKVSDNTGDKTMTVTLTSAHGSTLFSKGSIAENNTTWLDAKSGKATPDANFNPIPVMGTLIATLTPSGMPGSGGMTCDVYIYMR